jgi:hypothetical protein
VCRTALFVTVQEHFIAYCRHREAAVYVPAFPVQSDRVPTSGLIYGGS